MFWDKMIVSQGQQYCSQSKKNDQQRVFTGFAVSILVKILT
jgi:hypothetical protein